MLRFIDGELEAEKCAIILSIKHERMLVTAWRWDLQVPGPGLFSSTPCPGPPDSYPAITETHRLEQCSEKRSRGF